MILLTFIIGSILVLNIVGAQNDTVPSNSVNVLENVIIDDAVGSGSSSEGPFSVETFLNILLGETVEVVTSLNETVEDNETSDETSPLFVVNLGSGRITRGETVSLNANVLNTGYLANNVYFDWVLPVEFEIVSGELRKECGNLDTDASCYSEISVMINPSTEIGLNEIKVVVNYEE
jgi:hypothetical protein